jgi:hypothetical protein
LAPGVSGVVARSYAMGDIPGMPNQVSGSASFSGRSISAYRTQ